MDVGASGLIKEPGDKDFTVLQNRPAHRADSGAVSPETIRTPGNVHEPVGSFPRRKNPGFYPFLRKQPEGTDRTGPGHPGFLFQTRPVPLTFPFVNKGRRSASGTKKKIVPKIEESQPNHHKT
jgi:hypothetical protein